MALRHAAAGFIEAERGFRRTKGYRKLTTLIAMLSNQSTDTSETKTAYSYLKLFGAISQNLKLHGFRDMLAIIQTPSKLL